MAPRAKLQDTITTAADVSTLQPWELEVLQRAREAESGTDESDPDDAAELQIGDRIRAALAQTPGERARVSLFRRDPDTKARQWCQDYTPDQFDAGGLELIRSKWGAGTFEIRAFGSRGLITRANLEIAASAVAPVLSSSGESPELLAMLRGMAETQAAIVARLNQPSAPAPDPVASMGAMFALMGSMREAMGMNHPAAPTAPAQSPVQVLTELMGAMRALKEVSSEVNPPESDPDSPMAMLGPIVGMVKDVMQARAGAAAQEPMPMLAAPPSLQDHAAPENANMNSTEKLVFDGTMARLLQMASQNASAAEGAAFIYDTLPDEFFSYLELPNWFDILVSIKPALAPHRVWLEGARIEALALWNAPEEATGSAG